MPKALYLEPERWANSLFVSDELNFTPEAGQIRIEHNDYPGIVLFVENQQDPEVVRRTINGMLMDLGKNLDRVVRMIQSVEVDGDELE